MVALAALALALIRGSDPMGTLREATTHYQHIEVAEADGFIPLFECIEHDTDGAMGIWAWLDNPSGTFADWKPGVTCIN